MQLPHYENDFNRFHPIAIIGGMFAILGLSIGVLAYDSMGSVEFDWAFKSSSKQGPQIVLSDDALDHLAADYPLVYEVSPSISDPEWIAAELERLGVEYAREMYEQDDEDFGDRSIPENDIKSTTIDSKVTTNERNLLPWFGYQPSQPVTQQETRKAALATASSRSDSF